MCQAAFSEEPDPPERLLCVVEGDRSKGDFRAFKFY